MEAKDAGKTVVHCHGCFDLLHPGHVKYFEEAASFGDMLVVTATPDRFVDKGPNRPVFTEDVRLEMIAALRAGAGMIFGTDHAGYPYTAEVLGKTKEALLKDLD